MNKIPRIIPRGKYLLVQPNDEKSRVSEHGIVTPGNVEQEKKSIGTVVQANPEVKDIKKGDQVIYGLFAGERISMQGSEKETDFVLLHDDDILATIEMKYEVQ